MPCPDCGRELLAGTAECPCCGRGQGLARHSGLATAALWLGLASLCCSVLTAVPGIILGIVALVQIRQSGGRLAGHGTAIAGIVACSVMGYAGLTLFGPLWPIHRNHGKANQITCLNNLKQMALATKMYTDDNHEIMPASDKVYSAIGVESPVLYCPVQGKKDGRDVRQPTTYGYSHLIGATSASVPELAAMDATKVLVFADADNAGDRENQTTDPYLVGVIYTPRHLDYRHNGNIQACFLDGHGELFKEYTTTSTAADKARALTHGIYATGMVELTGRRVFAPKGGVAAPFAGGRVWQVPAGTAGMGRAVVGHGGYSLFRTVGGVAFKDVAHPDAGRRVTVARDDAEWRTQDIAGTFDFRLAATGPAQTAAFAMGGPTATLRIAVPASETTAATGTARNATMTPRPHTLTLFLPAYADGRRYEATVTMRADPDDPAALAVGEVQHAVRSASGRGAVVQFMFYGPVTVTLTDMLNAPSDTVGRPLVGAVVVD